MDHSMPVI